MKIHYMCLTDAGNILILLIFMVVMVRVMTTLVRPLLRVGISATEPVLYLNNIRVNLGSPNSHGHRSNPTYCVWID